MDTIKTDTTRNTIKDLDLEPIYEQLDEDRYMVSVSYQNYHDLIPSIDDRTTLINELIRERAAHRAADERTKEYLASLVVVVAVAGITVVGSLTGWW